MLGATRDLTVLMRTRNDRGVPNSVRYVSWRSRSLLGPQRC
jgi:hypothetical protein